MRSQSMVKVWHTKLKSQFRPDHDNVPVVNGVLNPTRIMLMTSSRPAQLGPTQLLLLGILGL